MNTKLSDMQVCDLARTLTGILEEFYKDPKNEEGFQKWLATQENQN